MYIPKHHSDPDYTGEYCPTCGEWTDFIDEDGYCDSCRPEPEEEEETN